jgi:hypothetical protein
MKNLLKAEYLRYTRTISVLYGIGVDELDVEEFDKDFPPKEKLKLPGQIFE